MARQLLTGRNKIRVGMSLTDVAHRSRNSQTWFRNAAAYWQRLKHARRREVICSACRLPQISEASNSDQFRFCHRANQPDRLGFAASSTIFIPAFSSSASVWRPVRALRISSSAMSLRSSLLSSSALIFLQTKSSAAVILAIVLGSNSVSILFQPGQWHALKSHGLRRDRVVQLLQTPRKNRTVPALR